MLDKLKEFAASLKQELAVYRLVIADGRTPWLAKFLLGLAVAYGLSPIDVIPDFIPVLGQLDDLILIPALILWALKLVPAEVIEDARRTAKALEV